MQVYQCIALCTIKKSTDFFGKYTESDMREWRSNGKLVFYSMGFGSLTDREAEKKVGEMTARAELKTRE